MPGYGCKMCARAVALVLFEIVERKLLVNASHDAISRHFGAYGSRGNDELDAVAFDD